MDKKELFDFVDKVEGSEELKGSAKKNRKPILLILFLFIAIVVLTLSKSQAELEISLNEEQSTVLIDEPLKSESDFFSGQNNESTSVIVDAREWDSSGSEIRMSELSNKGQNTQSLLEIINGGVFKAKALKMIHGDSVIELVDGYIELNELVIGGEDGSAIVNHHSGKLRVDKLKFGMVDSRYYFAGVEAELCLKGDWTVQELLSIKNSMWVFQGEELKKEQLQVSQRKLGEETYSTFKLK